MFEQLHHYIRGMEIVTIDPVEHFLTLTAVVSRVKLERNTLAKFSLKIGDTAYVEFMVAKENLGVTVQYQDSNGVQKFSGLIDGDHVSIGGTKDVELKKVKINEQKSNSILDIKFDAELVIKDDTLFANEVRILLLNNDLYIVRLSDTSCSIIKGQIESSDKAAIALKALEERYLVVLADEISLGEWRIMNKGERLRKLKIVVGEFKKKQEKKVQIDQAKFNAAEELLLFYWKDKEARSSYADLVIKNYIEYAKQERLRKRENENISKVQFEVDPFVKKVW